LDPIFEVRLEERIRVIRLKSMFSFKEERSVKGKGWFLVV